VNTRNVVQPLPQQDAAPRTRHVFVRDLVLPCLIGVHRHEQDGRQRVRINLDLAVIERDGPIQDRLANVLCYEALVADVRALVDAGHVNLVETLAERIAGLCLAHDDVRSARVRVEKLDVFADAASVGVEIERFRPTP
jgi:dihydroneopterin aldolase